MMLDINYDDSRPLMRLEKGDNSIIHVGRFPWVNDKDKDKYKNVQCSTYEATCIVSYRLECKEYPELSGSYNYWRGDKWGCSESIYASEISPDNQ